MADGVIHQLNTSAGGVPKLPVEAAAVGPQGLEGDEHADREHHGGPDQALCLYALEVIEGFAAEGHPIAAGSTGENVTVRGLDWTRVTPGTRLRLGEQVRIEVTGYATPCKKNARWFQDGNIARLNHRVSPGRSRVYARVLQGGPLHPGDPVALE